jgi:hypothetical protein
LDPAERRSRIADERRQTEQWMVQQLPQLLSQIQDSPDVPPVPSAAFQEQFAEVLIARRETLGQWHNEAKSAAWLELLDVELRRWRMERSVLRAPQHATRNGQTDPVRNRLRCSLAKFLETAIGVRLLGTLLPTGLAARSPFRFLAVPACVPPQALQRMISAASVEQIVGRGGQAMLGVGYGDLAAPEPYQVRESLLAFPERGALRLVHELFWPHVPAPLFEALRREGDLTSDRWAALLTKLLAATPDTGRMLIVHAIAVVFLAVAMTRELAFATGRLASGFGYWEVALAAWNHVLSADSFWDYIGERAASNRLQPADVAALKSQLPTLLAGVLGRFAQTYGGRPTSCVTRARRSSVHGTGSKPRRWCWDIATPK